MWNFHANTGYTRTNKTWDAHFFNKGMKQSVKNYATACYIICREKKSTNGIRSNTVGVRYERITTYVYICGPWPFPVSDLY